MHYLAALFLHMFFGPAAAMELVGSPTLANYAAGARAAWTPMGGVHSATTRCAGSDSTLEMVQERVNIPQHDVDLGRTTIRLRRGPRVVTEVGVSELWTCLAYVPSAHRYVIGSENEHGVSITLRALVYIDERSGGPSDSVFDRVELEANAHLLSPDARYLVLVGRRHAGKEDAHAAMFSLDLQRDELERLGPPPAAPPLDEATRNFVRNNPGSLRDNYGWDAMECGVVQLEPEVASFVCTGPDKACTDLIVSFGHDTWKGRGKVRHARRYALAASL